MPGIGAPPDGARRFWDREVIETRHVSWLEHPLVRDYVNDVIGGWPMDWFERRLGRRRFERALSIGCGSGALERDVILRGICRRVDAFDGSVTSLRLLLFHQSATTWRSSRSCSGPCCGP
ncbi:MAG TPA: hypothetical protein VNA04_06715 [Thermoanaerobaculia bacterium]|nr:hypothetical protein [Thermoanaerobaculia bacterium]